MKNKCNSTWTELCKLKIEAKKPDRVWHLQIQDLASEFEEW